MTSAAHAASRKKIFLPILMTCAGYACYNVSDAATKSLLLKLHFSQVMMTSGAVLIFFMAVYGWMKDGKKAFRTNKPGLMLVHAVFYQLGAIANLIAFPHIQLTTFYTLVFTSPFMVALLSNYFLKDKIDRRGFGVILFGFCVILFIFRPGGGLLNVWSLLVLSNSFFYSCRMVLVRHIGAGESRSYMFMSCALLNILTGMACLGGHYVPLTLSQVGLFLLTGVASSTGLLCLSYAFQTASSSSVVAPYHYTQIIWGALLGYFIFSEVPDMRTMAGAALLILVSLYLIRHEMRKAALKPVEA